MNIRPWPLEDAEYDVVVIGGGMAGAGCAHAPALRGAGYYFDDLLVYPERLCLENVLSACRLGARAFNYAQVAEIVRDGKGRITGVRARDLLTGRVATLGARIVVNATGPWVDQLRDLARVSERGP